MEEVTGFTLLSKSLILAGTAYFSRPLPETSEMAQLGVSQAKGSSPDIRYCPAT